MTTGDHGRPWRVFLIGAGPDGVDGTPYAALNVGGACCARSVMAAWGISRPQDHSQAVSPAGLIASVYQSKVTGEGAEPAMLDRVVLQTSEVAHETRSLLVTLAVLRHGTLRQQLLATWYLVVDVCGWWKAGCPDFYAGDEEVLP